jgi:hypothetical protein
VPRALDSGLGVCAMEPPQEVSGLLGVDFGVNGQVFSVEGAPNVTKNNTAVWSSPGEDMRRLEPCGDIEATLLSLTIGCMRSCA